jgi:hypothetical protein
MIVRRRRPPVLETLLEESEYWYDDIDTEEMQELQEDGIPWVRARVLRRSHTNNRSSRAIVVVLDTTMGDLPVGTVITLRCENLSRRGRRSWRWLMPGRTVHAFGIRDGLERFQPGGEVGIDQLHAGWR